MMPDYNSNASNWMYAPEVRQPQQQTDEYGNPVANYGNTDEYGNAPFSMPSYLQNRATQDRFASDAIMRRLGVTSLPNTQYDWVMGLRDLPPERMQELMRQGLVYQGNSGGDGAGSYYGIDWSKLPTIMGMDASNFVRYDPDSTRVRMQNMVFNDPNYGLVTLGGNVIQPRDTGLAGILPSIVPMIASQFMPGIGLLWNLSSAATARSGQQQAQAQMQQLARNMQQQRAQQNVQRQNPLMGMLSAMMARRHG